ncbi:MAG: YifB family Mg chelatase-like AAA ATPase [Gammaproteobacteria bacterium]
MSLALVKSRARNGFSAYSVNVEIHLSHGMPGFSIVGLPETVVRESRDRVRSAIINSGYDFPLRKLIVNLAPADIPKDGGGLDLPIALGILAASGQIPLNNFGQAEYLGELALSGELRPITGALLFALSARASGVPLFLPAENADEAMLPGDNLVYAVPNLRALCEHLQGRKKLQLYSPSPEFLKRMHEDTASKHLDLLDVKGQTQAKRALEIAAAGRHSLLMVGPPGTGKTLLASRLAGIMPPLSTDAALEVAALYSISNSGFSLEDWGRRPFRAPHHTASAVALVGGGSNPKPGEVSLAHQGVLFLDELPEYERTVLEVLREPLESHKVTISRIARQVDYPANFQLIAAMNPCPCGYLGDEKRRCTCSRDLIARYRARISGPIMDRIDMHLEVPALAPEVLMQIEALHQDPMQASKSQKAESSAQVKTRVLKAHELQRQRRAKHNAELSTKEVEEDCVLEAAAKSMLNHAMNKFGLSARAYHRILRVARTIADLEGAAVLNAAHVSEAIAYRKFDRQSTVPAY